MGSGTTGIATRILGLDFLGFELNPKICRLANETIESEKQELLPLG